MITVGIIGAMEEEIELLKQKLDIKDKNSAAGMDFFIHEGKGMNVVIVRSGIGKVNAALCTQMLIDKFHVDMVINTGVAGAVGEKLNIGDMVISSDLVEHDMDVAAFGYKTGQVPRMDVFSFKGDDRLVAIARESCDRVLKDRRAYIGRIASGDQFVADEKKIEYLRSEFDAMAVEMEGAAIGHACYVNNVPFVVLRSISDKADKSAHVDFDKFVMESSRISAGIVEDILSKL